MTLLGVTKRCCLIWTLLSLSIVYGIEKKSPLKLYDVPKAMVIYKISGGGVLSEDVNLSIKGKAKLRFKEWGNVEFLEKELEETTTGALHYKKEYHLCKKRQEKQVLDVDFHTKKIHERPLPKGKKRQKITAGLEPEGQQMVANVVCNMWRGRGVRRCIYKGIPLFTEYRALGLLYREEAVDVIFDINITNTSECTIPSFPVEKFALYTASFKTKNKKSSAPFEERLKQSIVIFEKKGLKEEKLSPKQKQKLLNILAEPMYVSQKKMLPNLLKILKKTRVCLSQAGDTTEANRCMKALVQIKSYFTDNRDNHIDDWDKEREGVLDAFDEKIGMLQSHMKCIRSAKYFSDLATCMKQ